MLNQVAAAEADRSVIEQRAREGQVLAPTDGRVLTVPVTPGAVVLAGEEIARIASGGYFLRLSLPERHAAEITEGATVESGERGRARLVSTSDAADDITRSDLGCCLLIQNITTYTTLTDTNAMLQLYIH